MAPGDDASPWLEETLPAIKTREGFGEASRHETATRDPTILYYLPPRVYKTQGK